MENTLPRRIASALRLALGYAAAVTVATLVAVAVAFLADYLDSAAGRPGAGPSFAEIPMWLAFGWMVTALHALPGFVAAVAYAEVNSESRNWWFAGAGVATALAATLIGSHGHGLFPDMAMNFGVLLGGAIGGIAYWAVAGRTSGGWSAGSGR